MGYEVIHTATETLISDSDTGLKVRVTADKPAAGTAFGIGTLYVIKSGFIPVKIYQFQAVSEKANVENLKKLAIFFFASLLDTELYVVEIPRDSRLFPEEAARIFGTGNYERAI